MLNFNRRDGAPEPQKDGGKYALKPALYEPPQPQGQTPHGQSAHGQSATAQGAQGHTAPSQTAQGQAAARTHNTPAAVQRAEAHPAPAAPAPQAAPGSQAPQAPASAPAAGTAPATRINEPGSTLSVGVNIKLKGVEISDCDRLEIEGQVEATVHSREMEIQRPGVLTGTALIDVAEVHGQFTGELTARTRLVVHGSGRVSGTIRYGTLVVAEGGMLSGDVQQLERVANAQAGAPNARNAATPAPAEPVARRA